MLVKPVEGKTASDMVLPRTAKAGGKSAWAGKYFLILDSGDLLGVVVEG